MPAPGAAFQLVKGGGRADRRMDMLFPGIYAQISTGG